MAIVPNCLCMIHKSHAKNNGKFVTTIKKYDCPPDHVWEIDTPLFYLQHPSDLSPFIYESQLIRIDGFKEKKLIQAEELEPVYS